VALYDRQMTIEELCRDTKSCRFGVRLEWTPCRTPAYLARFTLLVGVALVLWTAVGQAVAQATPWVRLRCERKGPACPCGQPANPLTGDRCPVRMNLR
jgi:hypothetical protein